MHFRQGVRPGAGLDVDAKEVVHMVPGMETGD